MNKSSKRVILVLFVVLLILVAAYLYLKYFSEPSVQSPQLSPQVNINSFSQQLGKACDNPAEDGGEIYCPVQFFAVENKPDYCVSLEGDSRTLTYEKLERGKLVNVSVSVEDYCWINFASRFGSFYCENVTEESARSICNKYVRGRFI